MKTILIDKIIMYITCLLVSIIFYDSKYSIAFMCIAIIFTSIHYIDGNFKRRIFLNLIFFVLCMFFKELIFFIPLAVYDGLFIGADLLNFIFIIPFITNLQYEEFNYIICFIPLAGAVYLRIKSNDLIRKKEEYNKLRDDNVEINKIMEEKNHQLIINQDYEIKMAALNERNRISKELHDSIGHLLSRSLIQVGALITISKDENEKRELNKLKDSLSDGMDSVRKTIHNMHDSSFDLQTKIEEIVNEFKYCDISLDYFIDSYPEKEIKYGFVSIVKESLANIIKHSNATKVYVTVGEQTSFYQLIIYDNGKIDNENAKKINKIINKTDTFEANKEMGLAGMIERAAALKGHINISVENGLNIFVSVPKKNVLCSNEMEEE